MKWVNDIINPFKLFGSKKCENKLNGIFLGENYVRKEFKNLFLFLEVIQIYKLNLK